MKYYATFIRSVEEDPIYHFSGAKRRRNSIRHYHATTKPSTTYKNKKMISLLQSENDSRNMPKVIPETSVNLETDTFTVAHMKNKSDLVGEFTKQKKDSSRNSSRGKNM